MAIADVPDAPLSTVEVFVTEAAAELTLTLLLLHNLKSDLREFGGCGVDAVAVEFHGLVAVPAIVPRIRTPWAYEASGSRPPTC